MILAANSYGNYTITALNGKQGIVHPQILIPAILRATIQEFEENKELVFTSTQTKATTNTL